MSRSRPVRDELEIRIAAWPGVIVLTAGQRGARFCTGRGEFLHFHGDRQMDVRLWPIDRDDAIAAGRALFHPRSHEGGWVIVPLSPDAFRNALRLAAAAYRRRMAIKTSRRCQSAARQPRLW